MRHFGRYGIGLVVVCLAAVAALSFFRTNSIEKTPNCQQVMNDQDADVGANLPPVACSGSGVDAGCSVSEASAQSTMASSQNDSARDRVSSSAQPITPHATSIVSQTSASDAMSAPVAEALTGGSSVAFRTVGEPFVWTRAYPAGARAVAIEAEEWLVADEPQRAVGDTITLSLVDGTPIQVKLNQSRKNTAGPIGMSGSIDGDFRTSVCITTYQGEVLATIRCLRPQNDRLVETFFQTWRDPQDGQLYLVEMDPARMPVMAHGENDVMLVNPQTGKYEWAPKDASLPLTVTMAGSSGPDKVIDINRAAGHDGLSMRRRADAPRKRIWDDNTTIDMMVIFTNAAKAWVDANPGGTLTVWAAQAITKSNEVHVNSNTHVTFNLVHTQQDSSSYSEAGRNNASATPFALGDLSGTTDGMLDYVHTLRDTHGADLVALAMTPLLNASGVATLPAFSMGDPAVVYGFPQGEAADGFSVGDVEAFGSSYVTMPHEWGHNLGCGHSAQQAKQTGPGVFTFAAGWQWNDTNAATINYGSGSTVGYSSIMTYADLNNNGSVWYYRAEVFSSPLIYCQSTGVTSFTYDTSDSDGPAGHDNVTGTTTADNARCIREMKDVIASYRVNGTHPAPTRLYVNATASGADDGSSWANACPELHDALALAGNGTEVWVAKGTYKMPFTALADPRLQTFLIRKGVKVYGGFAGTETSIGQRTTFYEGGANETILSGDIGTVGNATDNTYNVVKMDGGTLNGVSVTGGNANYNLLHCYIGGGVVVVNDSGATSTIQKCHIRNNSSSRSGGGLAIFANGTVVVEDTVFSGNFSSEGGAAAAAYSGTTNFTFDRCVFYANEATLVLLNQIGGAIAMTEGAPTVLIKNSIFLHNVASLYGGAIASLTASGLTLFNCTFLNNTTNTTLAQAIYKSSGIMNATNVIITDGAPASPDYVGANSATANFNYCYVANIEPNGTTVNTTNAVGAPTFQNAAATTLAAYRGADGIWATSDDAAALTAALAGTATGAPTVDITGANRTDGTTDVGCFEYGAVMAPNAPNVSCNEGASTSVRRPTWTWTSGGGNDPGVLYRFKLDNSDLTSGADMTTLLTYTPASDLSYATHTLYVQQANSGLSLWSPTGSYAVTIINGSTPPSAPTVTASVTSLATASTINYAWTSAGGGSASGYFRYRFDNSDLTSGATNGFDVAKSQSGLTPGPHTLYVQESSPDHTTWSPTGSATFLVPECTSRKVSAGSAHSVYITAAGALMGFGDNTYGQLAGAGSGTSASPASVTSGTWTMVTCGSDHTLAIKSDGTLWAWGRNNKGQLGIGSTTNASTPVQIGSATNWMLCSAGGEHSAAINTSGHLYTWGGNASGQLGFGNTTARTTPARVGTDIYGDVAAGGAHTLAIRNTGALASFGANSFGQLGLGNTTNATSPQAVGAATDWIHVSAGRFHSLGIRGNGTTNTLYAWGNNEWGQLGDGSTTDRTSPVQEATSATNWTYASAGSLISLGVRANRAYHWGYNVGSTPAQYGNLSATDVPQVAAGYNRRLGVQADGSLATWGSDVLGGYANGDEPTELSVTISLQPPLPPKVSGAADVVHDTRRPTWTWETGGRGGIGEYRVLLDLDLLALFGERTSTPSFTPVRDLPNGLHTLYVQERNAEGYWSLSGSFSVTVQSDLPIHETFGADILTKTLTVYDPTTGTLITGGDVDDGSTEPAAELVSNLPEYRTGDLLGLYATLNSRARECDVYLGIFLPDGRLVCVTQPGASPMLAPINVVATVEGGGVAMPAMPNPAALFTLTADLPRGVYTGVLVVDTPGNALASMEKVKVISKVTWSILD